MTNYNELIGRHLVKVDLQKCPHSEIFTAVDGIIEEVDDTSTQRGIFFRINGSWKVFASKADVKKALIKEGKEHLFDTYYTYFKIY